MILVATACPRFDKDGDMLFDGKIVFRPFVETVPTKRSSKNRAKGVLEQKPGNVDRKSYKNMLLQYVIPVILAKWPERTQLNIKMQHDNAPAHVATDDADVAAAGYRSNTTHITLEAQRPNSPDFNVLYLGLLAVIHSL